MPGATRRVVRLLVLLGVAAAAYLVLSLFSHEARADTGSHDVPTSHADATNLVDSVKATTAGTIKAAPKPKPAASKAHSPSTHRLTTTVPKKIHKPKIRTTATVRREQVRTPRLRQPTKHVVRETVRAATARIRCASSRSGIVHSGVSMVPTSK